MSVYSPAQGTYGQSIGESVMYVSLFTGPGSLWPVYRGVRDVCQSIHRPREPTSMSVYSPAQGAYGQSIGRSVIYVSLFTGPGNLWPVYRGVCDLCQSIHRPREPMASL